MTQSCNLELLAPAGNVLKMKTAFAYGANAVYLGIPDFSLRIRINDFNFKEIQQAIKYAHQNKRKVYITANIFAHNFHLNSFRTYLKKLKKIKPDALIVSDPGILQIIKEVWPEAEIHLSTQANCTNLEAAKFWYKQGISRIILGREVTLKEIKEIHRALPRLELEYFVHGAMCMAYSGRCFLSKLFVDRSANLGDCAQPCRWQYQTDRYFLKANGHDEQLELVEEKHGAYILNSQDLCLIEHLPKLIKAGVTSFKIEGRAKSVYYQATVCAAYRQALDLIKNKSLAATKKDLAILFQELNTKLVHRGYTTGFLLKDKANQNVKNSHQASSWEFCGQVISSSYQKIKTDSTKTVTVRFKVHNTIKIGDTIEILLPGQKIINFKLKQLFNFATKEEIQEAHGGGGSAEALIMLPTGSPLVPEFSILRRKLVK